jgi:Na+/H+ antiporter NhaD/arsenite permease-like protein
LLRYLAFLVGNKYSSSGSRLYFAFYAFFALTGMFIGNDPLILSGTPFLVYFTDHASIVHPQGYLFTHFQISNLVSALLVSSNPTNLVLTSAFKISFLKYSAWTALPTVAAAIILYPLLRFYTFNNPRLIPPRLSPPHVDASKALNDKWGGIFGSTVFGITIVLLVGLSAGGQLEHYSWTGVWIVVLPAAVAVFTWDCVGDLRDPGRRERAVQHEREIAEMPRPAQETLEMGKLDPSADVSRSADQVFKPVDEVQRGVPQSEQSDFVSEKQTMQGDAPSESTQSQGLDRPDGSEGNPGVRDCIPKPGTAIMTEGLAPGEKTKSTAVPDSTTDTIDGADRPVEQSMVSAKAESRPETAPFPTFSIFNIPPLNLFAKRFPTPAYTLRRMPLTLVPFAFSMFILVEGLQHTGWIRVFGKWWAAWVRADSTGVAGSVWLMGTLSVLGCNVCRAVLCLIAQADNQVFGTNIGATILLSRKLLFKPIDIREAQS